MRNDLFGYALDRTDEIWFNAEGETREDAAAFAFREEPEAAVVYICDQHVGDKSELFDISDLLERAEEAASESEDFGHHEDSIYDHSPESLEALESHVLGAIESWLSRYPGPRIWTTINGEITEHHRERAEKRQADRTDARQA